MSKQTKSAKGKQCTIRVPFVCNHDDTTTVLAHINGIRFGHGTGKKVSDMHGAYSCSACHAAVDGRIISAYSKIELEHMHLQGVIETQLIMLAEGVIKL